MGLMHGRLRGGTGAGLSLTEETQKGWLARRRSLGMPRQVDGWLRGRLEGLREVAGSVVCKAQAHNPACTPFTMLRTSTVVSSPTSR